MRWLHAYYHITLTIFLFIVIFNIITSVKDARSVSSYLIIGHTFCNMLSILNELTLQKKFQNFVTNNVFLTKKVKTAQQQNTKSNINIISRDRNQTWDLSHPCRMRSLWATNSTQPRIEPGTSHTHVGCVTSGPPT